jgi:hypothetical protein
MRANRCFTVRWNDYKGEAEIFYADWFKQDYDAGTQIVILDALQDTIYELTKFYNYVLENPPTKVLK